MLRSQAGPPGWWAADRREPVLAASIDGCVYYLHDIDAACTQHSNYYPNTAFCISHNRGIYSSSRSSGHASQLAKFPSWRYGLHVQPYPLARGRACEPPHLAQVAEVGGRGDVSVISSTFICIRNQNAANHRRSNQQWTGGLASLALPRPFFRELRRNDEKESTRLIDLTVKKEINRVGDQEKRGMRLRNIAQARPMDPGVVLVHQRESRPRGFADLTCTDGG